MDETDEKLILDHELMQICQEFSMSSGVQEVVDRVLVDMVRADGRNNRAACLRNFATTYGYLLLVELKQRVESNMLLEDFFRLLPDAE